MPHGKGGGGKTEIVLKFDLGEGNEDAIFVKTRKDFLKMFESAAVRRGGELQGAT